MKIILLTDHVHSIRAHLKISLLKQLNIFKMKKDIEIQKNVIEELKCTPLIKVNEIGVAVKNGIVTLSGIVDSYPKKITIEKAVKKIAGVKGIAEDLQVKLVESQLKTDPEIAQAVKNSLEWHSSVGVDNVCILVENGWVTIDGSVDWDFQRKSATDVVQNIVGVTGITNNIKISHKPVSSEIKTNIQSALIRNANINANKINVTTEGNNVILSGDVGSWAEYEEAERSAWLTAGVSKVENNLQLENDNIF